MYIAPVGIANAADADAAYAEAIALTAPHQSSYGREAAGVLAAGVAEAMRVGATPSSIVETCLRVAKDATRDAIDAVTDTAATLDGWRDGGLARLRAAVAPYDSVGEPYAEPAPNARTPSRLHAIEELPVAIGVLVATGGDYAETVLGGVNYGRDADSIASMGGALAGALGNPLRSDWVDDVSAASRIDVREAGATMAQVAVEIFARDAERHEARARELAALTAGEVPARAFLGRRSRRGAGRDSTSDTAPESTLPRAAPGAAGGPPPSLSQRLGRPGGGGEERA
jgi:ADP-ribosylglycohydrolase